MTFRVLDAVNLNAEALAVAAPWLPSPFADAWSRSRKHYQPRLLVSDRAVVLVTQRPATAQLKVVASAWVAGAGAETVDGVVAFARGEGVARLVWEVPIPEPDGERGAGSVHPHELESLLEASGATQLRMSYASAPGSTGVRGWVHDFSDIGHEQLPYYAQTTDFTCGAVTALLAVNQLDDSAGLQGQSTELDRANELAFWRRATNFPAVDPLGLIVELHEEVRGRVGLEAWISVDGPTLLEWVEPGFDRDTKVLLQEESARQALDAGLSVHREWRAIADIAGEIRAGAMVIMLIDERPMHDDPTPHWVLWHAVGDGLVLVQDPWINAEEGETWLDGHDLAITFDEFERMARWGDPAYRAFVVIRP